MTDPRILTLVSLVFAGLGAYSLYGGIRRIRDARRLGIKIRWYTQIGLLTGLEYILLTFVFLLSIANRQKSISPGVSNITIPTYFVLLIAAAIVAGLVVHRGILDMRSARVRRAEAFQNTPPPAAQTQTAQLSAKDRPDTSDRQRERRKNAAAARRRRAGKS